MSGGKRAGAGRTEGSTKAIKRDVKKQIRWTPEEWARVAPAAKRVGQTPSAFVRMATLHKCEI